MQFVLKPHTNNDRFIVAFRFDWKLIEHIKKIPGKRWEKESKCWTIPAKQETYNQLVKLCKANKIELIHTDEIAQRLVVVDNELTLPESKEDKALEHLKQQKDIRLDLSEYISADLFPYQKIGHKFLEQRKGVAIIGDEPGLGKTLQAISYATKFAKNVLVICPASLKLNWKSEIEKFSYNTIAHVVNSGDVVQTQKDKEDPVMFNIVNYEILFTRGKVKKDPEMSILTAIHLNRFDCVIIDEAHRMKNFSAKVTRWIHKHLKKVPKKILLTGTPIKSRPIEFYSLLSFLDPIMWNNKVHYGMRYCNGTSGHFGYDFSGASNLAELYQLTSPYIIRRLKSEVLTDLPEKIYTRTPVEMTPAQRKEYNLIEADYRVGAHGADSQYHFARLVELKQFTTNIKINHAKELIQTLIDSGNKVVVFSNYLAPIHEIKKEFNDTCVTLYGDMSLEERNTSVQKFQNDSSCKVFVGTVGAAGVGLTLTASSTVLFIDLPWTPGDFQQAADRCHRIGQKDSVQVIMLECPATIDEHMSDVLQSKREIIARAIDNTEETDIIETSVLSDIVMRITNESMKKR